MHFTNTMKAGGPAAFSPGSGRGGGFTLVELLVGMAVTVLLLGLIMQVLGGATATIGRGNKRLDADSQARLVFDLMARDCAAIAGDGSLDMILSSRNRGNDVLYFHGEGPAWSAAATAARSPVALLGYRINSAFQLERLGKGLTWDGAAGVVCLAKAADGTLEPASTIAGRFPAVAGTAPDFTGGTDADHMVLAEQVMRMEICFALADGTTSTVPAIANADSIIHSGSPGMNDDANAGHKPGDRWWDDMHKRAWRCTDATPAAAVWEPLGLRDVAAIVVTLVILDESSANSIEDRADARGALANRFPDADESALEAGSSGVVPDAWNAAATALVANQPAGVPREAASQLRVYQRFLPLDHKPSTTP